MCVRARILAYLRDEATLSQVLGYEHMNYLKELTYLFDYERLKPKLDIVKK